MSDLKQWRGAESDSKWQVVGGNGVGPKVVQEGWGSGVRPEAGGGRGTGAGLDPKGEWGQTQSGGGKRGGAGLDLKWWEGGGSRVGPEASVGE